MAKTKLEELLEKCTPGKWRTSTNDADFNNSDHHDKYCAVLTDDSHYGWIVAEVCGDIPEAVPNGNLIALAPALARSHEAMRKILTTLSHCDLNDNNCASLELASKRIRNLVRDALAEAEKVSNG